MSGTSLDGIDLAHVCFSKKEGSWSYSLKRAFTIDHDPEILNHLKDIAFADDRFLKELDIKFGSFLGEGIKAEFGDLLDSVDFIASHGHTAKHNPKAGYTIQIGSAAKIYEKTQRPVINNFRAKDVSMRGQGAPLVPIGDRDLFSEYDYCLNLGGIANISFEEEGRRVAYDVCPFNMALNEISLLLGRPYDDGGDMAASGVTDQSLLKALDAVEYYQLNHPKSLGYEDYVQHWIPILNESSANNHDKLRTLVEHFTRQIALACGGAEAAGKMLVTGGGAYHRLFISLLKSQLPQMKVDVPEKDIIDFKEAIVFAYLGLLRYLNVPNCLASVTGAELDNCGGDMFGF